MGKKKKKTERTIGSGEVLLGGRAERDECARGPKLSRKTYESELAVCTGS